MAFREEKPAVRNPPATRPGRGNAQALHVKTDITPPKDQYAEAHIAGIFQDDI
jgi:hypothetical protein